MKIVETDNFGRDYPDEKFVELPNKIPDHAIKAICDIINYHCSGLDSQRYWKTVDDNYELQPGFFTLKSRNF